jgi:hypothetical protein
MAPMRALILASGLLVVSGCSSSSTSSPQVDAGADAAPEAKVDTAADWSCVGNVAAPAAASPSIAFDFGLVDPSNNKPVAGATVKTCARTDTTCGAPLETATTDEVGRAKFAALPTGTSGFDGFFEVQFGSEIPNLNFQPPIVASIADYTRQYWGNSQWQVIFQAGGFKPDQQTLGTVGFQVHDCKGYLPGGITAELDVKDAKIVRGFIVYENGIGTVSTTATATSALVGLGGFFNVPPGPVTLTLKVEATGQVVSVSKVFARAGAYTAVVAAPTN